MDPDAVLREELATLLTCPDCGGSFGRDDIAWGEHPDVLMRCPRTRITHRTYALRSPAQAAHALTERVRDLRCPGPGCGAPLREAPVIDSAIVGLHVWIASLCPECGTTFLAVGVPAASPITADDVLDVSERLRAGSTPPPELFGQRPGPPHTE